MRRVRGILPTLFTAVTLLSGCSLGVGASPGPAKCTMPLPSAEQLAAADCSRDGGLDQAETLSYGVMDSATSTPRPVTTAEFNAADGNQDGRLNLAELQALLGRFSCWATAVRACPVGRP